MPISVAIDIAKEIHGVTAIDADGVAAIAPRLDNRPAALGSLIEEPADLGGTVLVLADRGGSSCAA